LGLIIFYFFSEATTKGMNSLLDRANVILKINFPRHIAILASTINSLVSLFLSLIIFFVFWFFTPTPVTIWWLTFIFYLAIFTFFVLGFSFFASILLVKFRDLGAIWEVALSALFYLTPIIYPFAVIPEKFQRILVLNPLTTMIRDARLILIGGQPPGLYSFLYLAAVSLIFFIAGYFYFKNNVKKIAEKI
jgi:ABC-type polysaccharide/polyol phosphate export permease